MFNYAQYASCKAYNYNRPNDTYTLAFSLHEVSGESGNFKFQTNVYRENGSFVGCYVERYCDIYNVKDMHVAVDMLMETAAQTVRDMAALFDVIYDITGADGHIWHLTNYVGRSLLNVCFQANNVECYSLTPDEVTEIANSYPVDAVRSMVRANKRKQQLC